MRLVRTSILHNRLRPIAANARRVAHCTRGKGKFDELPFDAATPTRKGARAVVHASVQRLEALCKCDVKGGFLESGKVCPWGARVRLRLPPEAWLPPGRTWRALRAVHGLGGGQSEWLQEIFALLPAAGMTASLSDISERSILFIATAKTSNYDFLIFRVKS